jgi:hypothetical protein
MLAPTLRPGQALVMDNLSAHKGERVRGMIEGHGCELLYLPPYSPDLNPIDHRGSVRQTQRSLARGNGAEPRGAHRGDGYGARGHKR